MKKNKNTKATIRRILSYLQAYRWLFVLTLFLAASMVAATLLIPILVGDAIDFIIGENRVVFSEIAPILSQTLIVIAIGAVAWWLMNVCNNKITFEIVRRVRNDAFDKIQNLPLSELDSHRTGETVSKIITDVEQFADGLLMGFTQFFTGVLTILGTLAFMLTISVKITLVVVVVTPLSLFVASFIATHTHSMFMEQSRIRAEQTAFVEEIIGNQKVVKAFGHEKQAVEDFDHINQSLSKCARKATFYSSLTNPCTRFINSLVYTGVALFGALVLISNNQGDFSVGQLTCFLSYANQYTKPFNEISGVVTELQNALACASRIFELIDLPSQSSDSENPPLPYNEKASVELSDVCFSYTPEQSLIEHLNLTVRHGKRIAIVGPTGCGKTTLINLLMRFYDVTNGSVRVGDVDIRNVTRKSLRENYGMVLQETWLRSGTIRDNITLGRENFSEEEIIQAAKLSHADSFIRRLPKGYDTIIGEGGGLLSQGQKQLLCITRVMLRLPPMLILDEATSAIDTSTELKIQSAFARMMHGRTSFIVAHRLSTIKEADVILVMKDGHIVEQGNHEELLSLGGFYATLYNSQFET